MFAKRYSNFVIFVGQSIGQPEKKNEKLKGEKKKEKVKKRKPSFSLSWGHHFLLFCSQLR